MIDLWYLAEDLKQCSLGLPTGGMCPLSLEFKVLSKASPITFQQTSPC